MTCPTPEKTAFTSERAAKKGLRSIKNPQGWMHPYRCGGHWHLGHGSRTRAKKTKQGRRARTR